MHLHNNLAVLPLAFDFGGGTSILNLALLLDSAHGASLVDAGVPGQADTIVALLADNGVTLQDVRRIIITHQDFDHVGSLHDLVQAGGAEVLASAVETPTLDGTQLPRFARPEILAQRPELQAAAARFRPTPVNHQLQDGDVLDIAGGVLVIATPGHTPGHLCLYHQPSKTLIAADALTAQDGQLNGPNQGATLDMAEAARSVAKLAQLDIDTIICYHGGVVRDGNAQLKRVAQELSGRS